MTVNERQAKLQLGTFFLPNYELNPMCNDCINRKCIGEDNMNYTDCVFKIRKERKKDNE